MTKPNALTYKWLVGILIPFIIAGIWYYVKAQDTARVDLGKRIDTVAVQGTTNRDTIAKVEKDLAVFRAEVKGDMNTIKAMMQMQMEALGIPQRMIETAKANGDSVRDTT